MRYFGLGQTLVAATVSALVLSGFSVSAREPQQNSIRLQHPNPPVIVAADEDILDLCDGEQLSLSPSGAFLASYSLYRGEGSVFETDCILSGQACNGWRISSMARPEAFLWRSDDTVAWTPTDGPARDFDPRTGSLVENDRTALSGLPHNAGAYGILRSNTAQWMSGLPQGVADYKLLGLSVSDRSNAYALLDPDSHHVTLVLDDGSVLETDLSARWGSDWAPIRGEDGRIYLIGKGILQRLDDGALSPALPDLYQPRPVIDASTGRLTASYSDDHIRTLAGRSWNDDLFSERGQVLDHIESSAYASSTELYAVKSVNLDGSSQIVLAQGSSYRRIDCGMKHYGRMAKRIENPPPVSVENWGTSERPLMVRRRMNSGVSRPTLVFWQGGPGGTFAMGGAADEQTWIERGFDVVSVDGSGSQGVDQGRRLRERGLEAVFDDAQAVARRLAGPEFSGSRIIVMGGSFGGIAAAETARRLATLRPEAPSPQLLLMVPWLRYRDPADYNEPRGRERFNEAFMEKSDAAAFGSVDDYAVQMNRWRDTFKFDGPTLVVFAEADKVSRAEDMWKDASSKPQVSVRVIPRIDHRFVGASATTQAEIKAWLEANADNR